MLSCQIPIVYEGYRKVSLLARSRFTATSSSLPEQERSFWECLAKTYVTSHRPYVTSENDQPKENLDSPTVFD